VVLQGATIANVARSVGNEDKQFGQAAVLPAWLTEGVRKTALLEASYRIIKLCPTRPTGGGMNSVS
jgi:hypothetical protein